MPMTVADFMKFKQPVTMSELVRKFNANLVQVKSNVFDFDKNSLASDAALLEFFPGLIKANEAQQIDGFNTFGGIFQYDQPAISHCLMVYLSHSQMVIEIHTSDEGKPVAEDLLKTLRSMFKKK